MFFQAQVFFSNLTVDSALETMGKICTNEITMLVLAITTIGGQFIK